MRTFKDLAINTKLRLLVILAGGVALLLSTISFVLNDVSMIRNSMITQMLTLSDVLGSNSTAALTFQDPDTAVEVLSSLRTQPAVEFACIYNAAGDSFATYRAPGAKLTPPVKPPAIGHQFVNNGDLEMARKIIHDDQLIGTIYLRIRMDALHDQMQRYVGIAAVMMIVSLAASILLSSRFQRTISKPILRLAAAAQTISADRNYGIRVTKSSNDELGVLYDQFNAMLEQIQSGEAAIQRAHDDLEIKIEQRTAELSLANKDLSREIAERLRAEHSLEDAHQKLMESARRAGMAEIATGVLHNVGNVLNSINVSATLVFDRMRQSKVTDLVRVMQMIEAHSADLGTFITQDPKGQQIPKFLNLVATHLADERLEIVTELELLTTKVSHIKAIIATQQSYAGVSGVIESVDIAATLDDAMKLNVNSFERHKITIVREFQKIPKVRLDKQKVLQILINLFTNAKEALRDCPEQSDRRLIVRTELKDDTSLRILIIDNGVGIPSENMTRIFSHGFTTKQTGHGFGLHSCANAANELGGSLSAQSDGPGKGATFVLELPYEPIEVPATA